MSDKVDFFDYLLDLVRSGKTGPVYVGISLSKNKKKGDKNRYRVKSWLDREKIPKNFRGFIAVFDPREMLPDEVWSRKGADGD